MPVLINFKICDNSIDCSGIEVCPTGAFHWDKKKKTIAVDNKKCTACGQCEQACPVNAIKVAKTEAQFKKLKKELDDDPRTISDLFIDRYGAQPIAPAFLMPEEKWEIQIIRSSKLAVVEFFRADTIQCLLKSIPIKDLFKNRDIKYRKLEVERKDLLAKHGIKKLPCLIFFKDGKMIGKIEGYFGAKEKKKLADKINNILNKPSA